MRFVWSRSVLTRVVQTHGSAAATRRHRHRIQGAVSYAVLVEANASALFLGGAVKSRPPFVCDVHRIEQHSGSERQHLIEGNRQTLLPVV